MSNSLIKGGQSLMNTDSALIVARKVKAFSTLHDDVKSGSGMQPILSLDVSYSMNHCDEERGRNRFSEPRGRRRIDHLREAIEAFPEMRRVSFSTQVYPDAVPEPVSSTNMAEGLRWIRENAAGQFDSVILISDGDPDSQERALEEAKLLGVPVNTIFIGVEGASGQKFLARLSEATNGQTVTTDPKELKQLSTSISSAIKGFLPSTASPDSSGEDLTKREAICL